MRLLRTLPADADALAAAIAASLIAAVSSDDALPSWQLGRAWSALALLASRFVYPATLETSTALALAEPLQASSAVPPPPPASALCSSAWIALQSNMLTPCARCHVEAVIIHTLLGQSNDAAATWLRDALSDATLGHDPSASVIRIAAGCLAAADSDSCLRASRLLPLILPPLIGWAASPFDTTRGLAAALITTLREAIKHEDDAADGDALASLLSRLSSFMCAQPELAATLPVT